MRPMKTKLHYGTTLFLRLASGVIGLGVLTICLFVLPAVWIDAYKEFPHTGSAVRIIVAAMYIAAIPFYLGIYSGWKLLGYVDRGEVFSPRSVTDLRSIMHYASSISILYLLALPLFYLWQDEVDAPGLLVIGLFLFCMPLIVSVAMGLLARILAEAVKIKSENELTV